MIKKKIKKINLFDRYLNKNSRFTSQRIRFTGNPYHERITKILAAEEDYGTVGNIYKKKENEIYSLYDDEDLYYDPDDREFTNLKVQTDLNIPLNKKVYEITSDETRPIPSDIKHIDDFYFDGDDYKVFHISGGAIKGLPSQESGFLHIINRYKEKRLTRFYFPLNYRNVFTPRSYMELPLKVYYNTGIMAQKIFSKGKPINNYGARWFNAYSQEDYKGSAYKPKEGKSISELYDDNKYVNKIIVPEFNRNSNEADSPRLFYYVDDLDVSNNPEFNTWNGNANKVAKELSLPDEEGKGTVSYNNHTIAHDIHQKDMWYKDNQGVLKQGDNSVAYEFLNRVYSLENFDKAHDTFLWNRPAYFLGDTDCVTQIFETPTMTWLRSSNGHFHQMKYQDFESDPFLGQGKFGKNFIKKSDNINNDNFSDLPNLYGVFKDGLKFLDSQGNYTIPRPKFINSRENLENQEEIVSMVPDQRFLPKGLIPTPKGFRRDGITTDDELRQSLREYNELFIKKPINSKPRRSKEAKLMDYGDNPWSYMTYLTYDEAFKILKEKTFNGRKIDGVFMIPLSVMNRAYFLKNKVDDYTLIKLCNLEVPGGDYPLDTVLSDYQKLEFNKFYEGVIANRILDIWYRPNNSKYTKNTLSPEIFFELQLIDTEERDGYAIPIEKDYYPDRYKRDNVRWISPIQTVLETPKEKGKHLGLKVPAQEMMVQMTDSSATSTVTFERRAITNIFTDERNLIPKPGTNVKYRNYNVLSIQRVMQDGLKQYMKYPSDEILEEMYGMDNIIANQKYPLMGFGPYFKFNKENTPVYSNNYEATAFSSYAVFPIPRDSTDDPNLNVFVGNHRKVKTGSLFKNAPIVNGIYNLGYFKQFGDKLKIDKVRNEYDGKMIFPVLPIYQIQPVPSFHFLSILDYHILILDKLAGPGYKENTTLYRWKNEDNDRSPLSERGIGQFMQSLYGWFGNTPFNNQLLSEAGYNMSSVIQNKNNGFFVLIAGHKGPSLNTDDNRFKEEGPIKDIEMYVNLPVIEDVLTPAPSMLLEDNEIEEFMNLIDPDFKSEKYRYVNYKPENLQLLVNLHDKEYGAIPYDDSNVKLDWLSAIKRGARTKVTPNTPKGRTHMDWSEWTYLYHPDSNEYSANNQYFRENGIRYQMTKSDIDNYIDKLIQIDERKLNELIELQNKEVEPRYAPNSGYVQELHNHYFEDIYILDNIGTAVSVSASYVFTGRQYDERVVYTLGRPGGSNGLRDSIQERLENSLGQIELKTNPEGKVTVNYSNNPVATNKDKNFKSNNNDRDLNVVYNEIKNHQDNIVFNSGRYDSFYDKYHTATLKDSSNKKINEVIIEYAYAKDVKKGIKLLNQVILQPHIEFKDWVSKEKIWSGKVPYSFYEIFDNSTVFKFTKTSPSSDYTISMESIDTMEASNPDSNIPIYYTEHLKGLLKMKSGFGVITKEATSYELPEFGSTLDSVFTTIKFKKNPTNIIITKVWWR